MSNQSSGRANVSKLLVSKQQRQIRIAKTFMSGSLETWTKEKKREKYSLEFFAN